MNYFKFVLVALFAVALAWMTVPVGAHGPAVQGQGSTALERGYRTGYSDGYNAGYADTENRAPRDYRSKDDYQRADRAYVNVWGPLDDYRDGYQQGYESGYDAGYDKRTFASALPDGFKKRGTTDNQNNSTPADSNQSANQTTPANSNQSGPPVSAQPSAPADLSGTIHVARDATLLVELETPLSTDVSQRGDRFRARVVEPHEYTGAIIEGHLTDVKRPGKVKGTATLQLSFDRLVLPDNRTADLHAELVEVVSNGSSDGVGSVDKEGGVKGKDSTKDDVVKVGAGAGIGALIGAIAGGGKGAAIGAVIGGGLGTGSVLTSKGKDIRLDRGQQLRIRTATETTIQ